MDSSVALLLGSERPFVLSQCLDLVRELLRELSSSGEAPQPFSFAAPAAGEAGGRVWLSVALEVDGFCVREAEVAARFSRKGTSSGVTGYDGPGRAIAARLVDSVKSPWVLEQVLRAVNELSTAGEVLREMQEDEEKDKAALAAAGSGAGAGESEEGRKMGRRLQDRHYRELIRICEQCDQLVKLVGSARNAFLLPNPLGFPQILRPFNAFSPTLPTDVLIEFNVFCERLVVSAYTILPISANGFRPDFQGVSKDIWFSQDTPELVGKKFVFEQRAFEVLEQQIVTFSVPAFAKALIILGDVYETITSFRDNVIAHLRLDERFCTSLSVVSVVLPASASASASSSAADDSSEKSAKNDDLVQPSLVFDDGQSFLW